jgi:hypothetical protein
MQTATITAGQLLSDALALVESASIRAWATSDHNAPIWAKMAEKAVAKGTDVNLFSAYIVSCAIGL